MFESVINETELFISKTNELKDIKLNKVVILNLLSTITKGPY